MPGERWDCHAHIFGPPERYRLVEPRGYTPPVRTLERLASIGAAHDIGHFVIVHPSVYGSDDTCLLDALRAGQGRHRGVTVVAPDVSEAKLAELHALGVRGARFNLVSIGGNALDGFDAVIAKVRPLGWHAQVFAARERLPEVIALQQRARIPFVVDHFGSFDATTEVDGAAFEALLRFVESGNGWVKLSGFYRLSRSGPPYRDLDPLAHALWHAAPERLVWGSDWPHTWFFEPGHGDAPAYGSLLDPLKRCFPDEAMQRRLLVDNPQALYA